MGISRLGSAQSRLILIAREGDSVFVVAEIAGAKTYGVFDLALVDRRVTNPCRSWYSSLEIQPAEPSRAQQVTFDPRA